MDDKKIYRAIGLMSGTSLDGIDAALIETDGYAHVKPLAFKEYVYAPEDREMIRKAFGRVEHDAVVEQAEARSTQLHIDAVHDFLQNVRVCGEKPVDLIGYHGQTIFHDPQNRVSVQLGDGQKMASALGISVVDDFRSADVSAGGQGAPLLPLYHRAISRPYGLFGPVVFLNIGGVSNVTWIGSEEDDILAFDCGPGNALIDDFVLERTGNPYDKDGNLAKSGQINHALVRVLMAFEYFSRGVPKSLDRDEWDISAVENLSAEDGAATLSAFTVEAIVKSAEFFPQPAAHWLVCGGGRKNVFLMENLRERLGVPVEPCDAHGMNGDALEAEGFAYLAVRSLLGESLSLPDTTGVPAPQTGGMLHKP